MAQAKDTSRDTIDPPLQTQPAKPTTNGRAMPDGTHALEYRPRPGIHLSKAGSVVKSNWVGYVVGRSVRVYYGAPEASLPEAVRAAVLKSNIAIGTVTLEEMGIRPRETGIINITQQRAIDGG